MTVAVLHRTIGFATTFVVLLASVARAQSAKSDDDREVNEAYLREHYTKYEYNIQMRDGINLFAAVYAPKDDSERYPILLTRTPYSAKPS